MKKNKPLKTSEAIKLAKEKVERREGEVNYDGDNDEEYENGRREAGEEDDLDKV